MKLKKFLILFLLFSMLTSCTKKIVHYTEEDVSKYNLKETKTSKAKMINVRKVGKDTVWTFQESFSRGLQWQTIDHHYMDSVSAFETNTLTTNYQTVVLDYYLKKQKQMIEDFSISYTYVDGYKYQIMFSSDFNSREELKNKFEELKLFQQYVSEKNSKYVDKEIEYKIRAGFTHANQQINIQELAEFETVDEQNLENAIVYQDKQMLQEYSEEEIKQVTDNNPNQIYIRDDEEQEWLPTDYYTFDNQLAISSTVLFDILSQLDLQEISIEGTRDDYIVYRNDEVIGKFNDTMIPFLLAEKICNIQFSKENLINKESIETNGSSMLQ